MTSYSFSQMQDAYPLRFYRKDKVPMDIKSVKIWTMVNDDESMASRELEIGVEFVIVGAFTRVNIPRVFVLPSPLFPVA
jgi:hypothetical protein